MNEIIKEISEFNYLNNLSRNINEQNLGPLTLAYSVTRLITIFNYLSPRSDSQPHCAPY